MEGGCASAPQETAAVVLRRFPRIALAAAFAVAAGTAATVAMPSLHRAGAMATYLPGPWRCQGPRAVVRQPFKQLGIIETPAQFAQTFLVRNQGDAPLELAPGPSTCKCTVTELPARPIPPGGQGEIRVAFSAATKHDTLKTGPLARSVSVLSNDPAHNQIVLTIAATVRCRLAAAPSPITLTIDSADLPAAEKRSAETLIYSQTWRRFELAAQRPSRPGMTWRIRPATAKELDPFQAHSGYHVGVTLPADLADGRFAESVEFVATPPAAAGAPHSLAVQIQGSVDGRVTLFGRKIDSHGVLRLGALQAGEGACETILMKVRDPRPLLVVRRIETEPDFLHVRINACQGHGPGVGLYRVEVEIPREAPPGNFMADRAAVVRLWTDHPRLPLIEWKVDFAKIGGQK